jgi:hypothetical protein
VIGSCLDTRSSSSCEKASKTASMGRGPISCFHFRKDRRPIPTISMDNSIHGPWAHRRAGSNPAVAAALPSVYFCHLHLPWRDQTLAHLHGQHRQRLLPQAEASTGRGGASPGASLTSPHPMHTPCLRRGGLGPRGCPIAGWRRLCMT